MAGITRFAIRGLYDERDIEIPFDDNIKIIVAENGYGKTTVLNALYGMISGDLPRLRKIAFRSLEVDFEDGEKFELEKTDLEFPANAIINHIFYDRLRAQLGSSEASNLLELFIDLPASQFARTALFRAAARKSKLPAEGVISFLKDIVDDRKEGLDIPKAKEKIGKIKSKIGFELLYLPTYRRVEQDFRDVGIGYNDDAVLHDDSIQNFTEVCNRYLADNKLAYNESNITVDIVRRKNGHAVDIEKLSSGEKQIISLFAKLYLQKGANLAIFLDEPELSLSIEWQKTLLPDIINSGKCGFLFTATHSPFIFENELISHTVDLANYIKEL